MRRRPGLAGLRAQKAAREKLQQKGRKLEEDNIEHMTKQLQVFRENLEKFAAKHKDKIAKNPQFRQRFYQMCAQIGVDPLASRQGFWDQLLGIGNFYYELAVQIIQMCMALRPETGGLISLKELHKELSKRRTKYMQKISPDDIETSIQKVAILGSGFRIERIGEQKMVVSVPTELNTDHSAIIGFAKESGGYVTKKMVMEKLKWSNERLERTLNLLEQESMLWIDEQGESGTQYWFPCLRQLS